MAIAEIQAWLNGNRDFEVGKQLYLAHGDEDLFKSQLNLVETSFLRKKLITKLSDVNQNAIAFLQAKSEIEIKQTTTHPPEFEFQKPEKNSKPVIIHNELPTFLQKRDLLKSKRWKQLNELRHSLSPDTDDNEVRLKNVSIIKKISNCDDEITQIWKELNYYVQTGELLKKEEEIDLPFHVLRKKLTNVRTYVTKSRGVEGKEHLYKKHSKEVLRLEEILENVV
jgi:hypothetical protein